MAVALDDGLIVPVIRGADALGPREIARASGDLVERARAGRLKSRRDLGRHVHRLQPRHVPHHALRRDHQPAGARDPRGRGDAGAARSSRDGEVVARPMMNLDAVLRPPRHLRCRRRAPARRRSASTSRSRCGWCCSQVRGGDRRVAVDRLRSHGAGTTGRPPSSTGPVTRWPSGSPAASAARSSSPRAAWRPPTCSARSPRPGSAPTTWSGCSTSAAAPAGS